MGDIFLPKSIKVPCSLACAKIPNNGITIAERQKPIVTINHWFPALKPSNGGKIKLPAPKKRENNAKAVTKISFFVNMATNKAKDYYITGLPKFKILHDTKKKNIDNILGNTHNK